MRNLRIKATYTFVDDRGREAEIKAEFNNGWYQFGAKERQIRQTVALTEKLAKVASEFMNDSVEQ